MGDNPHISDDPPVLGDEITQFDGSPTPGDVLDRHPIMQAVGLAVSKGNGQAAWVSDENPVSQRESGTYGYKSGTTAGTVDVPAGARLRRVSVAATESGSATVQIGGGDVISIPQGGGFDEQIPGAAVGADIVVGGNVLTYYVSWTT